MSPSCWISFSFFLSRGGSWTATVSADAKETRALGARTYLECLDQKCSGRWNHFHGNLTVDNQELAGNAHALPVLGGLGEIFTNRLWGLPVHKQPQQLSRIPCDELPSTIRSTLVSSTRDVTTDTDTSFATRGGHHQKNRTQYATH